jgi:hypothetical protein
LAGVTRSKLGGQVVLDMYQEYLKDKNIELVPKYAIAKRVCRLGPSRRRASVYGADAELL